MKLSKILIAAVLLTTAVHGQYKPVFRYSRALENPVAGWNRVPLPVDLLAKAGVNELRIINEADSSLTPFLTWPWDFHPGIAQEAKQVNESWQGGDWFVTLQPLQERELQKFTLSFANENFDWRAKLEGSNDGKAWFTVSDNYRMVGLKNAETQYQYADIVFNKSNFREYRLSVRQPKEKPVLMTAVAEVLFREETASNVYSAQKGKTENRAGGTHIHYFTLAQLSYIQSFAVKVANTLPYSRSCILEGLMDSVRVGGHWEMIWQPLAEGRLRNGKDSVFSFEQTRVQQLRLTVEDADNEPLQLSSAAAKGPAFALWVRIPKPGRYILLYGDPKAAKPQFDLQEILDSLPQQPPVVKLGGEKRLQNEKATAAPLAKQWWLWVLLVALTAGLAFFGWKLLKTSPAAGDSSNA